MNILSTCHSCGKEVSCLEKDMSEKTLTMEDGHILKVSLWTCPLCGFVHTVQIDDENTQKLFQNFRLKMSRLRRNTAMGKRVSQADVAALDALQTELDNARTVLNARYDGSFYQLDGQQFKLELCPPEARISGEREEQNVHE